MIYGTGIDIVEIERIKNAVEREGFLEKCFTSAEISFFKERSFSPETIAANFAVKEAYVKALGTGFRGIGLRDIEVLRDGKGKPYITHPGKNSVCHVSVSHCKAYAAAQVIIERID